MKTTMIALVTVLTILSAHSASTEDDVETFFQKKYPNKTPNAVKQQDRLRKNLIALEAAIEKMDEFCQHSPLNVWCVYREALLGSKTIQKRSIRQKCWPGIFVDCKGIMADVSSRPSFNIPTIKDLQNDNAGRCRPGSAHCPNGKRGFKKHCVPGFPWCQHG